MISTRDCDCCDFCRIKQIHDDCVDITESIRKIQHDAIQLDMPEVSQNLLAMLKILDKVKDQIAPQMMLFP